MQDRLERSRSRFSPGTRSDRLGGRVGLLSREAAVLDRESRGVAGGEHSLCTADTAVCVDRNKAVTIGWKPDDPGAFELSQRDDSVGVKLTGRVQRDPLPADRGDSLTGDDLDPAFGQERGNRLARSLTEHRQRRGLRRDQHQPDIGKALVL